MLKRVELSADVLERTRKAYEIFAGETEGDVWIAEMDGKLVGWCARDGAPNYISDLWVLPDHQGRGIGNALVLDAITRIKAEGHRTATIHTHGRNAGAIRLYQRCGFAITWRGMEYSKSMGIDLEKVHLERSLV